MRLTILGCGEAFDETLPNTSLLLETTSTILFDCGYSVPPQLWRAVPDQSAIDIIYISHAHADHYFGLPAVLTRMWEEGRTKPLVLLSQAGVLKQTGELMEMGYSGLTKRFRFPIAHIAAEPGRDLELHGVKFGFAPTLHSTTNLAVRAQAEDRTFCYSGDGLFTDESRALFREADLVVHEAYSFEKSPVHADIEGLVRMAGEARIGHLALAHVQRGLRREPKPIQELMGVERPFRISMPEPLDVLKV